MLHIIFHTYIGILYFQFCKNRFRSRMQRIKLFNYFLFWSWFIFFFVTRYKKLMKKNSKYNSIYGTLYCKNITHIKLMLEKNDFSEDLTSRQISPCSGVFYVLRKYYYRLCCRFQTLYFFLLHGLIYRTGKDMAGGWRGNLRAI